MSNVWGRNIKVSIFGESHGKGIGIVLDGLKAGEEIDIEEVNRNMQKRAPGNSDISTQRHESDEVEILSGIFKGKTTGAPVCGIIKNTDARSEDYNDRLPRPGTADLTAHIKYNGYNDYRGGGHFSGRLTAPLTFAGSLARQILERQGISIGAHILQISDIKDQSFLEFESEEIDSDILEKLNRSSFPLLNESVKKSMTDAVKKAGEDHDSVGGVIECASTGLPAGLGSPFFESMESSISSMMFSIPGVKAVGFGSGFGFAELRGSQANDRIYYNTGRFRTRTNHDGGINGGITNAMPLILQVVVRPTASIGQAQLTVDLKTFEEKKINIKGRHDPCIVPRAAIVVESALALCLLDNITEKRFV